MASERRGGESDGTAQPLGTSQVLCSSGHWECSPVHVCLLTPAQWHRTVSCLRDNAEAQRCKSPSQCGRGGSNPPPGPAVSHWIVAPQIHTLPGHVAVFGNEVAADVIR